jgi:pimeloyl-ACP methyl ester carboxylesterase
MTSKALALLLCASALPSVFSCALTAQQSSPAHPAPHYTTHYGANPSAANTFTHDGVRLYYETYGQGEPLLLIHGNGSSIAWMSAQIEYFRQRYRVIIMDSRDHGKSADTTETITYEKMTDDLAALLEHLHTGPAYILGWSDGGVEALELGIRHPTEVKKIAAMAANLTPEGLQPEALVMIKSAVATAPDPVKLTPKQKREIKVTKMMLDEPHIEFAALEAIMAPTLVLASDHDVIRDEHTLDIYHHIPNSQLIIFPNATHMIPFDDPQLFNSTIEHFFQTPFIKKERMADTMKSAEALKSALN